jgi:hypothetical protein
MGFVPKRRARLAQCTNAGKPTPRRTGNWGVLARFRGRQREPDNVPKPHSGPEVSLRRAPRRDQRCRQTIRTARGRCEKALAHQRVSGRPRPSGHRFALSCLDRSVLRRMNRSRCRHSCAPARTQLTQRPQVRHSPVAVTMFGARIPWQFHDRSRRNRSLAIGARAGRRAASVRGRLEIFQSLCVAQPAIRLQPDRSAAPPPDR